MKYLFWSVLLCLLFLETTHAQTHESYVRLGLHSSYMPQFTVQEASDNHVRPLGVRLMISDYDMAPFEFGVNAYANYGETARFSFGVGLAYLFAEWKSHDFKAGLSMSKIELEDVLIKDVETIGPQVGDVRFQGFGQEFKPYVEWEWIGTRYASLFVQVGYCIINGDKTIITAVEEVYNPELGFPINEIRERDHSFFYSASGFDIGMGLSIHLY